MFIKKILFPGLFFVLQGMLLFAQQDTVYPLPPVIIGAASLRDGMTGERMQRFDTALLAQSAGMDLGSLLALQGNIYIKSYGLGSLSTSAMRGGSASQTAITWNGVPLQSPMLGLTDLALLPVFLADEVSVHYGSSGAQWGSGAVGGRIALQNKRPETPGWRIGLQAGAGSFGHGNVQVKGQYSHRKWAAVTRVLYNNATNNFPWSINDTLPEKIQTNAAAQQLALLQDLYWQITPRQQVEAHFWWQNNDREIPPTSTQNKSVARQFDEARRATLQWKYFFQRNTLSFKSAYTAEAIDYQDEQINLRALSHFETQLVEVEDRWAIHRRLSLQTGVNYTGHTARADGYKNGVSELRGAVFAVLQFQAGRWETQANLRQEWVDGRPVPLIPAAGSEFKATSFLSFKAKSARQSRLPTLNDRYGKPGGNPNLLPENGWSHEAGWVFRPVAGLEYQATAFHRRIRNWILWSQTEGQSFWSSNNITSVFSRGIEQQICYGFGWKKIRFQGNAAYDYTRSTNETALSKPQLAAGEQLLYAPVHQAGAGLSLHYKKVMLQYRHRYSGAVKGINERVPDYNIGFARCQISWRHQHAAGLFFIQTDNLWNKNYRVVERRPMPGRSYQTGVSIQFFQ